MLETYSGILRENRIEWCGETPGQLPAQGVPVHVTLLVKPMMSTDTAEQGRRMAACLEKLAEVAVLAGLEDPVAWERETRQDRPLPGREL